MNSNIFFSTAILFLSVVSGAWIQTFFVKKQNGLFKLMLSFSAAYLLALSLLHILPEVFMSLGKVAGWYILGGFLLQVVLDYFSHGVEHGHHHYHSNKPNFIYGIMAALWIHAFIEGMPFGGDVNQVHHHSHDHDVAHVDFGKSLLIGISLHKLTEGFVVAALLRTFGYQRGKLIFWLCVFALIAPAGAFFNQFASQFAGNGADSFTLPLLSILVGILLHVSTIILFENDEHHKFNRSKFVAILGGIIAAALIS
jgi:zinc transporter ZupT